MESSTPVVPHRTFRDPAGSVEQVASGRLIDSNGGQFDDRPAYIVKLPSQQQPARIDTPFAAVRTRALIDAIMHNQLRTPADLASWTRQQP